MRDFCLPDPSKPRSATPKVDKNRDKCVIFVYLTLETEECDTESRQNPPKLKKYSARLPSPKQFGLRLRSNLRNRRFAHKPVLAC